MSQDIDRILLNSIQRIIWTLNVREIIRTSDKKTQDIYYRVHKPLITKSIKLLHRLLPKRYTDAEPFKIILIDPNMVEKQTNDHFRRRGWVIPGDWDRRTSVINDTCLYEILRERFIQKKSWEKCGYIDYIDDEIRSGGYAWGISSEKEIQQRLSNLDDLWVDLQKNGYKSQSKLIKQEKINTYSENVDTIHPKLNEVGVDISRSGELLWNRVGHHRLIMAKLLNLEEIPALVYRRHVEWQQLREDIQNQVTTSIDHPDLQDIRST